MKCLICGKEFTCTRHSPLCSTEKSRGFPQLKSYTKEDYISGKWLVQLKHNLSQVDYSKLEPNMNHTKCLCFNCYTTVNLSGKEIAKIFSLDYYNEILHFFFMSKENEYTNGLFPDTVSIVLICYGREAVALEKL